MGRSNCLKEFFRGKFQCFIWMIYIIVVNTSQTNPNLEEQCRKMIIAVPDRVKESNLTIPELQQIISEFFSEVSQHLSVISNASTFLGEVQVLVPSLWRNQGVDIRRATFETYSTADIRLDSFNPLPTRGNLYTVHAKGCGERGDFIYLHPDFLQSWKKTTDKSKVQQFAQEWLKLSYGIFQKISRGNYNASQSVVKDTINTRLFKNKIALSSKQKCPDISNLQCTPRTSWQFFNDIENLKSGLRDNSKQSIAGNSPKINFVTTYFNAIVVIDSDLCQIIMNNQNHWAAFALRKFIKDSPDSGYIVIVIANEHISTLRLDLKNNWKDHYQRIFNLIKTEKCDNEDYTTAFQKAKEMSSVSEAHVVAMSPYDLFVYLPNSLRQYFRTPIISLQSNDFPIANRDSVMTLRVEEEFNNFFTKFANEDFYPQKIKIGDSIASSTQAGGITYPLTPSTIIVNYYSRGANADLSEDLSFSKKWEILESKNTNITFTPTIPQINITAWSAWFERSSNPIKATLDAYFSMKLSRGLSNETNVITQIFSFNPNDYKLKMNIWPAVRSSLREENSLGNATHCFLRDDGKDSDKIAGDKIYSANCKKSAGNHWIYNAKLFATDSSGEIVAEINFGRVILYPSNTLEEQSNRIDDFRVEISNDQELLTSTTLSPSAVFSWSLPGVYYKSLRVYSVRTYKLKCNNETIRIDKSCNTTEGIVHYHWYIPNNNITYRCVLSSMSPSGIWSNWSNIALVFPLENTTNSVSSTTQTINDGQWNHLGRDAIFIGVFIFLTILLVIGFIWYHRSRKLSNSSSRYSVRFQTDFVRHSSVPFAAHDVYRTTTEPKHPKSKRWNFVAPKEINNIDCDQTMALLNNSEDYLTPIELSINNSPKRRARDNNPSSSPVPSSTQQFRPASTNRKSNSHLPISSICNLPLRVSQFMKSTESIDIENDIDSYAASSVIPQESVDKSTELGEGIYGKINK